MPADATRQVIIVGGGWAGLSAAVRLSQHGITATLFESAKQLGGRARCTRFGERRVDNGQHLLIGAYHNVLDVLRTCGVDLDGKLYRANLDIDVRDRNGEQFRLRTGNLPLPFNLVQAMLATPDLSLREKISTIMFLARLRLKNFRLREDITVQELLRSQPEKVVRMLWEPLCLAALNTAIDTASAQLFLNVLRDSFTGPPGTSDLLYSRTDLGSLFVHPAMQFIDSHGGMIRIGQQVKKIIAANDSVTAIDADGNWHEATDIILATSATASLRLLEESGLSETTRQQLQQLQYEPICTVYLQYDEAIKLDKPMLGLTGCHTQWVFDRRICGQPGLMAAVISAQGPHSRLDKLTLSQLVSDELSGIFGWPDADEVHVIREKRATFQAHVDVDRLRPGNRTEHAGIWLAGDYTQGPYPATLEGAVQSGLQCADAIIEARQGPQG